MHLRSQPSLGRETLEHVRSTDGTPIAVWKSGDGPPLVLVHGATADHSRWAPVLPALPERFTVLAIDRRGRGRSGDAARYAIEREYEDVAAVVDWAGEQVSVLGHSYGGVCALEATRLTEGIGRLVLYEALVGPIGPAPGPHSDNPQTTKEDHDGHHNPHSARRPDPQGERQRHAPDREHARPGVLRRSGLPLGLPR